MAVATGSRPLGGVVLAAFGVTCMAIWLERDGRRTALVLTAAGLLAFAVSHGLGLLIGAWPAVLLTAAATAAALLARVRFAAPATAPADGAARGGRGPLRGDVNPAG